jgi:hypothetical protein
MKRVFLKSVHVYYVLSDVEIFFITLLIENNEEEVESGHDGG